MTDCTPEDIRFNRLRTRDAAIAYAELGLLVLPVWKPRAGVCTCPKGKACAKAGKHPRTRLGLSDATADPRALKRWKWETANIGIQTGAESGILVFDIDDETAWKALRDEHGPLPRCPCVETPRPGWHLYYRHPGGHVPSRTIVDGVDIKAEGGYVVAPPSLHARGGLYLWYSDPTDFPELPTSWRQFLSSSSVTQRTQENSGGSKTSSAHQTETACQMARPSEVTSLVEMAISKTLPTGPGQRHHCLFRLARKLRSIPGFDGKPAASVISYVRNWYEQALPFIRTKDWLENWGDFAEAWDRVRYLEGTDKMTELIKRAATSPPPAFAHELGITSTGALLLIRVCRELQREAGAKPFFLSARKAAEVCDTNPMTAWRWLRGLAACGVLQAVSVGNNTSRKASEWRYLPSLDG